MAKPRVLVAMSGGVDSAVAALRLLDDGYDVVGCTLHLWDYEETGDRAHARCCAPEDQYDARRMADCFGFPHYAFDRRELFRKTVVEPFVDAYLEGNTPSPCTSCNKHVKLTELFSIADKLGAELVATGHYARVVRDGNANGADASGGEPRIAEGRDKSKDQSYFLYATPRAQIARLVFPLGESTKAEVRAEAVTRRIPGATKGESQELCFVGAGAHAYEAFVEERGRARVRPGNIVDADGRVVAKHDGVFRFTVGQRKGLGVALGKPAFVTRIDADTATVSLGGADALLAREAALDALHLGAGVDLPLHARVRVRYRHEGAMGRIERTSNGARIAFDAPVRAITPGQICVFYKDEIVLGGGKIVSNAARAAAGDGAAA
jgi:tRNA-specific 2-thiouridylase